MLRDRFYSHLWAKILANRISEVTVSWLCCCDPPNCLLCLLQPGSKYSKMSTKQLEKWSGLGLASPLTMALSTQMYSTHCVPYWGAWIWSLLVAVHRKWRVPQLYPNHGYLWQPSCTPCIDTHIDKANQSVWCYSVTVKLYYWGIALPSYGLV